MESTVQNLTRANPGSSRPPPVGRVGGLGKFDTFWMPKSSQEITQRAGTQHSQASDAKGQGPNGKPVSRQETNAQTSFRDLIHQKQDQRPAKTQRAPSNQFTKPKSQSTDSKASPSQHTPAGSRLIAGRGRLVASHPANLNAKNLATERVVPEKPHLPTSHKKELQDALKQAKDNKDREMPHQQGREDDKPRDHGTGNAKRGRSNFVAPDSKENATNSMVPASRDSRETLLPVCGDAETRALSQVGVSSDLSGGIPVERFLRSNAKSQRDARRGFAEVRQRIGGFMSGETRMARIAIDLPGGGRLGIKMRFVGDQLEVIFATEDVALRAALLEDWRRLARKMSKEGSRLLPPAFAQENYEGIVRGQWNEAA